jgi:WD40 repeat protein
MRDAEQPEAHFFEDGPDKLVVHMCQWVHHTVSTRRGKLDRRPIFAIDWHPDGSKFATAGAGVVTHSIRSNIWFVYPFCYGCAARAFMCLCTHYECVSPIRRTDGVIKIWNASCLGRAVSDEDVLCVSTILVGNDAELYCVRFSPDGSWLASCDFEGNVCCFFRVCMTPSNQGCRALIVFTCLPRFVVGATQNEERSRQAERIGFGSALMNYETWQPTGSARHGHGKLGNLWRNLHRWSRRSIRVDVLVFLCLCCKCLVGRLAASLDLCWSPDSQIFATGSMEGTICIWRPPPLERRLTDCLQMVCTFDAHDNYVSGVAWDPCGRYLASQSHDGELKIWRTGDWTRETTVRISDSRSSAFFCIVFVLTCYHRCRGS